MLTENNLAKTGTCFSDTDKLYYLKRKMLEDKLIYFQKMFFQPAERQLKFLINFLFTKSIWKKHTCFKFSKSKGFFSRPLSSFKESVPLVFYE